MKRTRVARVTIKPCKSGFAKFAAIGDCHWGAKTCDKQMFLDAIDSCLKKKMPVIFMGDLLECATKYSVGAGVYEQEQALQGQIEEMVEIIRPLAEAGLVMGMLDGNHCQRAYKEVGINPTSIMCQLLGVPYLGYTGRLLIRCGVNTYTVFATHGKSNAKKSVTKLNAAINATIHQIVDLVLYAHTHALDKTSVPMMFIDKRNKNVITERKHIVLTGSFLSYENSYAEDMGLEPAKNGYPIVRLGSRAKEVFVST